MKRKLLVFISSTYIDLKEERQAAVEAVLEAGHIPAGMELFSAGDRSQLETIKKWIDDSDVFLLILGGRYGSIEAVSQKSYIELEYAHAEQQGMRHFALVLNEQFRKSKISILGQDAVEQNNGKKLEDFRAKVLSKMCSLVEDKKDIKLSIYKALKNITDENQEIGWVPKKESVDPSKTSIEFVAMTKEISELHRKIADLQKINASLTSSVAAGGSTTKQLDEFKAVAETLSLIKLVLENKETNALDSFVKYKESFVSGLSSRVSSNELYRHCYASVGPQLVIYGLAEYERVPGLNGQILRTTKLGNQFLAWAVKLIAEGVAKSASS
ncbi:DUF4062 domain-containing protein [Corallococcus exercitus]|uniref:DUF4062 domain-containing protein n=1 Tax=Corallococcus exercitus TaxID=2316736 RepID=A0A7Y4NE38_9BACT|nr:DUF4062 domain-containing protein [Corallococcus exercitus]NOK10932.1 DUF4062 domain-containing protein [Corallococcus exercitus]